MSNEQRTVVITGGNSGIGFATAEELARRGAKVIMACRNTRKADEAKAAILAKLPGASVHVYPLDLASFSSIHQFSEQLLADVHSIDALINNAGIYPAGLMITADGFETQFGVNYLGHFLLTHLLLPALSLSADARVIHLSSIMHNFGKIDYGSFKGEKKYSGFRAYSQSKLANAMFSHELSVRLPGNISSNALHPGGVDSEIYRDLPKWFYRILKMFLISADRAAVLIADMAVSPRWRLTRGQFVSAHGPLPVSRTVSDREDCSTLYTESCRLVGLDGYLTLPGA